MSNEFIFASLIAIIAIIAPFIGDKIKQKYAVHYIFLEKDHRYKLIFWNASANVLDGTKLDIYVVAPKKSNIEVVDGNDKLPIVISEEAIKNNKKFKGYSKYKITLDYMCAKTGYVLDIIPTKKVAKIGLYGRIKYEDRYSVRYGMALYRGRKIIYDFFRAIDVIEKPVQLLGVIMSIIMGVLLVWTQHGKWNIVGWIYLLMGGYVLISISLQKNMPWRIKKMTKKYVKEGSKKIVDPDKLILYQNDDIKL